MLPSKVLSLKDRLVQEILRDFRVTKAGKKYIAHVEPEDSGLITSWAKEKVDQIDRKVFIRFMTISEWQDKRLPFLKRWLHAMRFHYLNFTFLPQLLVFAFLFSHSEAVSWLLLSSVFCATTFIHLSCNLWNDYEDHVRGVDFSNRNSGSGVIRNLAIPAIHLKYVASSLLFIGLAIGTFILYQINWNEEGRTLLALGTLGVIGAASYSGWPFHYKYLALGELLVFFLCGPLLATGVATVLFHGEAPIVEIVFSSLPLGLLAVLRLHGGNILRIPYDTQAKAKTIASMIGFDNSKYVYLGILFALYMYVNFLVIFLPASNWLLLCLLSFPIALLQFDLIRRMKGPLDPLTARLRKSAIYLDLSFGLPYCLGFFLAYQ